jgi:hypothetical protein
MRTRKINIIFIVFCCLLVAPVALCTYSEGATASVEITARVSLIAYNVVAVNVTNSTENITWMTNGLTNSTVLYGWNTSYDGFKTDSTMVTSHAITLEGLSAGQEYHYRVISSDSAGTTCTSNDFTFTTQGGAGFSGGSGIAHELTITSGSLIPLTADNLVSRPVAIVSADRSASLSIDPSTRILNSNGQPLNRIGLSRMAGKDIPTIPERSGFVFAGYAYRITPSGATFSRTPALKITTTTGEWEQISGKDISIQYYNPASKRWESLTTTTNQTTHTAITLIAHTSDYGLFARQTTPAPPVTVATTAVPTTRPNQKPWESILSIDIVQKGLELLKNYLKSPF